jgi:hypothetical protein
VKGTTGAKGATGAKGTTGAQGPGPTTVRKTNTDDTTTLTSLGSATGLGLAVAANTTYSFDYFILFQSSAAATGIGLALTGPASPNFISYTATIPIAADATTAMFSGWGTAYDDTVLGTAVQATGTTYVARIYGVISTGGTSGTLTPRFRSEINGNTVTIKAGSWGSLNTP